MASKRATVQTGERLDSGHTLRKIGVQYDRRNTSSRVQCCVIWAKWKVSRWCVQVTRTPRRRVRSNSPQRSDHGLCLADSTTITFELWVSVSARAHGHIFHIVPYPVGLQATSVQSPTLAAPLANCAG